MKILRRMAFFTVAASCLAMMCSCGGGDTIDGVTTENIVLHTGEDINISGLSAGEEAELKEKIKSFFDVYYNGTQYTIEVNFSERGEYGGEECYVFRSYLEDGSEGFIMAASVDGTSVYGCDNSRGLIALIWCEGWSGPDFSYFGEQDTSNL